MALEAHDLRGLKPTLCITEQRNLTFLLPDASLLAFASWVLCDVQNHPWCGFRFRETRERLDLKGRKQNWYHRRWQPGQAGWRQPPFTTERIKIRSQQTRTTGDYFYYRGFNRNPQTNPRADKVRGGRRPRSLPSHTVRRCWPAQQDRENKF